MIKQIQLRGISRTPSDRMSEDGGLSESLNMYLDTAENAPAFVPKDVTGGLGLPADLQAKRIFIHKTANYENYIVVQEGKIVAYTPGIEDEEPLLVMELAEGERVNDITSVGNTLIVSTTTDISYLLYNDRVYSVLDIKGLFPHIDIDFSEVSSEDASIKTPDAGHAIEYYYDGENINSIKHSKTDEEIAQESGYEDFWFSSIPQEWKEDTQNSIRVIDALIKKYENIASGYLNQPIFVRYAIDIYGQELSSMPILVNPLGERLHNIRLKNIIDYNLNNIPLKGGYGFAHTFSFVSSTFKDGEITVKLPMAWQKLAESWKDIAQSIKFYISTPVTKDYYSKAKIEEYGSNMVSENGYLRYTTEANLRFPEIGEEQLLEKSSFFLVDTIPLFQSNGMPTEELQSLLEGRTLNVGKFLNPQNKDFVPLETQDQLIGSDMKHYQLASGRLAQYNNSSLLVGGSQIIDYDYHNLNSLSGAKGGKTAKFVYDVTYFVKTYTEDKIINKQFVYEKEMEMINQVFAFQIFPDSRAYKMIVKVTTYTIDSAGITNTKYGEFNMYPHPYLDCAYYYGGIENTLTSLCELDSANEYSNNKEEQIQNKLLASEMDVPFFFPTKNRFTFQSKVIGVAVATTALSQGQFGQFPLYVFTEDGIWAMETGADGSFVSQKPLSREVCNNPDSITSIDNAVVFTTDKGVMMIQGTQVMNISPYMNGRHYTPNESALNIIGKQEGYDTFVDVISDDNPFMSFMKDAKVAYDYTGQRLVFISPSNNGFQYVYKIDTQTWHKVAFEGLDLEAPLNSYPECFVQGKIEDYSKLYWIINPIPDPSKEVIYRIMQDFEYNTGIQLSEPEVRSYLRGEIGIDVSIVNEVDVSDLSASLALSGCEGQVRVRTPLIKIYSLSTVLDAKPDPENPQKVAKGILITRPFDLGEPDVYKTIKAIKIRGDYDKGNVKYLLQGSDDGRTFYTLSSMRGKSWKMFRLFILADLEPTERISWVDIEYETRFKNRLR